MVAGFDAATVDPDAPYTITVSVNSVTDASQTASVLPVKQQAVSMTPSSVSPVLNSVLTITLESSYAHPLVAEEFDAVLVLTEDATVSRPLYIMSVDDSTK